MNNIINAQMNVSGYKVNKFLFISILIWHSGITNFCCSYGHAHFNYFLSLLLMLCGGISTSVAIHKLKERKEALKINCIMLFFICLEVILGFVIPPSIPFLVNLSFTHSGGGTYLLKALIMAIPILLSFKVVWFGYFSRKI